MKHHRHTRFVPDCYEERPISKNNMALSNQSFHQYQSELKRGHPSISLSSSHRIDFSSNSSLSTGRRLDFSTSSSTPKVPLHKASSITFFSSSKAAISTSRASNSFRSLKVIRRFSSERTRLTGSSLGFATNFLSCSALVRFHSRSQSLCMWLLQRAPYRRLPSMP